MPLKGSSFRKALRFAVVKVPPQCTYSTKWTRLVQVFFAYYYQTVINSEAKNWVIKPCSRAQNASQIQ